MIDIQTLRRALVRSLTSAWGWSRPGPSIGFKPLPLRGIHRILICRPNHRLGNLLLLTPLIAELEASYPGAQIDLLIGGDTELGLFDAFAAVGTIYQLPRHALRHPLRAASALRLLRQQRYDLAIDPDENSQSSRLLMRVCRSTYRAGFTGVKNDSSLTHGVAVPERPRHMAQRPVFLIRRLTQPLGNQWGASYPTLDIGLSPSERAKGSATVGHLLKTEPGQPSPKVVAVFTHATGRKRLSAEWWQQWLITFRETFPDYAVIEVLPAHGDSVFADQLPVFFTTRARRMAAVIAAASIFVSADCGVMHLACAARGPRVIGLFSSTDLTVYGPYGKGNRAISANTMASGLLNAWHWQPAVTDVAQTALKTQRLHSLDSQTRGVA